MENELIDMIPWNPAHLCKEGYYLFKTDATPKGYQYLSSYLRRSGEKMSSTISNQNILMRSKEILTR